MEITPTHITILNSRLPAGFKIEAVSEVVPHPAPVKRRSEAENLHFDMRFHASSARAQRVVPRPEFESLPSKLRNSEGFIRAFHVIQKLKASENIGYFLKQVDTAAFPDYYEIIQEPISLGEIEAKLLAGEYETMRQFADSVRRMWNNSFLYNSRGSDQHTVTVDLSAYFETLIRDCEHLSIGEKPRSAADLSRKIEMAEKELKKLAPKASPMTLDEKRVLAANISKLPQKYLRGVYDIVRDQLSGESKQGELEFNLDSLPVEVTRSLEAFVSQCLSECREPEPVKPEVPLQPADLHIDSESSSSSSSSGDEALEVAPKDGEPDYWSEYQSGFYGSDARTN